MKKNLTDEILMKEARIFSNSQSSLQFKDLFGITDGKAVGTYIEHKFREYLAENYLFEKGNSARGIDFPDLGVDVKVTSIKQPQSSCPYKSVRQKIFGLGYSLLVFVYEKTDDHIQKSSKLNFLHTLFVEKEYTADYQTTKGIIQILENEGNKEDLVAFMYDRNLPLDEIEANEIAEDLLLEKPLQGYLTISNALQWRLQYGRVIQLAGQVKGICKL